MRGFLTLCLIAVAASEKLGYNYSPIGSVGGGSSVGGGFGSGVSSGLSSGGSYSSGSGFGGSLSSGSLGGGFSSGGISSGGGLGSGVGIGSGSGSYSNGGGFSSGGSLGSGSYNNGGSNLGSGSYSNGGGFSSGGSPSAAGSYNSGSYAAPAPVVTELNKEYYFHTAPEEVYDGSNNQNSQSTLKRNLRVVFIKAPENNGIANAALQVAKQATEDQTAIYVLTKQADVSDITQQLQQISEVHSKKPEVHFVKYRTQEDALNAQRTIQAQYDSLGGSSKSSNEGIAPVLNYASSSPVSNYQGSASQAPGSYSGSGIGSGIGSAGSVSASAPSNSYIAPSTSYSAPSGTGSYSAPSGSYLAPKSSYLPPVSV